MKKIFSGVTVALLVVLMVSSFALARGRGKINLVEDETDES
jgi:hypothetical protein